MNSGLLLFKPGTPAAVRRRRLIFLAVWLTAAAMLLWPIFPIFSGVEPLILGLPLGFAWAVAAVLVVFFGLLWLYLGEVDEPSIDGEDD